MRVSTDSFKLTGNGKRLLSTPTQTLNPINVYMRPGRVPHLGIATTTAFAAVSAIVVVGKLMHHTDAQTDVTLMEKYEDNYVNLVSMHEPGTIEDIQHAWTECLGSSNSSKSHDGFTTEDVKTSQDKNNFPSLKLSLLNGNCKQRFEFNSREPIQIENDLFSGSIRINLDPQGNVINDTSKVSLFKRPRK
jgi:hypothetical protein